MQRSLQRRGKVLTEIRASTRGGSNRSAKNRCRQDAPRTLRSEEGGLADAGMAYENQAAAAARAKPGAPSDRTWTEAVPKVAGRTPDAEGANRGCGAISRSG